MLLDFFLKIKSDEAKIRLIDVGMFKLQFTGIQPTGLILALRPQRRMHIAKAEACGRAGGRSWPCLTPLRGGFRLQYFIKSLINGFIAELLPFCCGDLGLCSLVQ